MGVIQEKSVGGGSGDRVLGSKILGSENPRMKLLGMTNDECRLTNGGIASLSLLIIKSTVRHKSSRQAEYIIRCSTFNVRRSMFDVRPARNALKPV